MISRRPPRRARLDLVSCKASRWRIPSSRAIPCTPKERQYHDICTGDPFVASTWVGIQELPWLERHGWFGAAGAQMGRWERCARAPCCALCRSPCLAPRLAVLPPFRAVLHAVTRAVPRALSRAPPPALSSALSPAPSSASSPAPSPAPSPARSVRPVRPVRSVRF